MLCGQDAVQVTPGTERTIDFPALADKLKAICNVKYNMFMLTIHDGNREINVLRDGREIVRNVHDEGQAKGIYTEYFGL
jgi:adenylyltransferase/sulfurtransferase